MRQAVAGGRVTDSPGGVPRYASTSTRANCPVHPWLSVEEGRSAERTVVLAAADGGVHAGGALLAGLRVSLTR